jgi:CotS family spore coat protein
VSLKASSLWGRIWKELLSPPALLTKKENPVKTGLSKKKEIVLKTTESRRKILEERDGEGSYTWHEEDAAPPVKKSAPKQRTVPSGRPDAPAKPAPKTKHPHSGKPMAKYAKAKQSVRATLESHGFDPSVLDEFNVAFLNAASCGAVIRLESTRNVIALKRTRLSSQRVEFIEQALHYLKEQNFTRFSPIVPMRGGKTWTVRGNDLYYATQWIAGKTADLTSVSQLGKAAKTLSLFHKASAGFEPDGDVPPTAYTVTDKLMQRTDHLEMYLKAVDRKENPTDTDEFFFEHAPEFIRQADQAIQILQMDKCVKQLEQDEANPSLCHLDVTAGNLVYTPQHEMYLIDFDYMSFGPRILDLAHLIRRGMQAKGWSPDVTLVCISNYNTVNTLTHAEYMLIYAFLLFPHRFWRVSHNYFERDPAPKRRKEFERCLREEPARQKFLEAFARQVMRPPWK